LNTINLLKELKLSLLASIQQRYDLYFKNSKENYTGKALFFQNKVESLYSSSDGQLNVEVFKDTTIPDILLFLKISHKYYVDKLIPEIEQSLSYALLLVDGKDELWVHLSLFFTEYKRKLVDHIKEEEHVFFPILEKLYKLDKTPPQLAEIAAFIKSEDLYFITDHHDAIEDELAEIINVIKLYVDEVNQSMPLRIFINQINRFELELRNHAIIEDLLLMPMARNLESNLRSLVVNLLSF
jgi:regulator of cell morphogenesis and NO signaling